MSTFPPDKTNPFSSYLTGYSRPSPYELIAACPRCGHRLPHGRIAALSRGDDKTEICGCCEKIEAWQQYMQQYDIPLSYTCEKEF